MEKVRPLFICSLSMRSDAKSSQSQSNARPMRSTNAKDKERISVGYLFADGEGSANASGAEE